MIWSIILSFFKGPLSRVLDTIDKNTDATTERERLKTEAVQNYVNAQAQVLTGKAYWFPLFFLVPAGLHFASVCIYSILFCRLCAFPQNWVIAALPAPFDQWEGAIVGSLFIGKAGEQILSKWRSR